MSYSADILNALDAFIARHGERPLWLALAQAKGLSPDAFHTRVREGMSLRDAATRPRRSKTPVNPLSRRQRCIAMGYTSGQPFYKLDKDLTQAGIEHTDDDVFEILEARRAQP